MNVEALVEALKFVRSRIDVALIEIQEGEAERAAAEIDRAAERLVELVKELRA